MDNPRIGIITSAFKWKKFAESYIESVTNQNYRNFSVYICDDASPDESVDYFVGKLEDPAFYEGKGDNHNIFNGIISNVEFTLIQSKVNGRQGRGRNIAIKHSHPNCVAYGIHDIDDVWYPNFLSRHVEEWLKDPESIGLTYADYDIYDSRTGINIPEYKQSFSHEELHRHCTSSSNCLISRAAFEKCGPYNERISPTEDYDLSLKISNFFVQKHIPERLWRYTIHGENCTIRELDRHRQMHQVMVNDYQTWRQQQGIHHG